MAPRPRLRAPALALLAAALAAGCARPPPPPERVILIVIDTLRRDHVSRYGGGAPTPAIDALAARGLVFERALASFHQTSMSMGALFTGRTPSLETQDLRRPLAWSGATWCGLARFSGGGGAESCVPGRLATLAERMREGGYWTIGVASNAFLYEPSGFAAGFDDWVEVGRADATPAAEIRVPGREAPARWQLVDGERVNRAALAALGRRPRDRFFLYVHYMDVHDYRFRREPYREAVARADAALGRLLGRLEARGLLGEAAVVLTSDHGENLGDAHPVAGGAGHLGNPSYQEVLEVPLVIAPPVDADPSRPVRTQDLYFLIQRLAGLDPGAAPEPAAEELFVSEAKYRTYLRGSWKSTVRRRDGRMHLFDLAADPRETRDVADAHPDVARRHLVRAAELAGSLDARPDAAHGPSERDRERLRALGYLD